jgi:hypothetical protein
MARFDRRYVVIKTAKSGINNDNSGDLNAHGLHPIPQARDPPRESHILAETAVKTA